MLVYRPGVTIEPQNSMLIKPMFFRTNDSRKISFEGG